MDLVERLIYLGIGGFFGFTLGYICARLDVIKEEVDEIDEIVKHQRDDGEAGIARLRPVIQDVILFGVVAMVAYAAWMSAVASNQLEQDVENDKRHLCVSQQEQRNTDRQLVEAVFDLAVTAVSSPSEGPPRTEAQLDRANAYIDRVNSFRNKMYDQIEPNDVCKPYVEDDDVDPPPPPAPHLTK